MGFPQSNFMTTTGATTQSVTAVVKPLLLIVDDQPSNIELLHAILKRDYEVCMATSGAQAIAFCERQTPDLILLDIVMPGMNGYEVCHWLKESETTRDIPVIFVTVRDNPADEAQALCEGAVDFIAKPFHASVVLARIRTHLTLKAQAEQLRSLAMLDALTGLANRREFDATLAREWRQCARANTPLSMMMIDIDAFKRYNDHYGHQAGDACIQAVASVLKANLQRPTDLVARYGGDEFVCILPDTTLAGASCKAQELQRAIRALGIVHEQSTVAGVVTISLGVAVVIPSIMEDLATLIATADRLLYAAKQSGRAQAHCEAMHSSARVTEAYDPE